jgi:RNA polymerase sigma-70 factor (ECF subfamily)
MRSDLEDRQLAGALRGGDMEALRQLYERHSPRLHALASHLLGSADDADDLVQDIFVGLRHALAQYDERGSFEHWLRRVAVRAALMRLRSERRSVARAAVAGQDSAPHGSTLVSDPPLAEALSCAIAALPVELRTVAVLRLIGGHGHEEIAAALGISAGASKVRFHRAVARLRKQLHHLQGDL